MSEAERTGEARQDQSARLLAGRYRLGDVLGRGGMGTVWRAKDETLGRTVAVKELRFPSSIDEDEKRRLITRTLREAKAIARIRNTSAVTVFDVVDEDDRPWIVMELVEGKSLAEAVREDGLLTPRRAAEVGLAVLDVLRSAHREGILHRDVKPSNVLIAEDGRVVLTDFGIAQVEGDPSITSTGMLVGAPSYISPERARGHKPGPAADLWSLGGLIYAAVEGVPPYDKGSAIATLTAVMTEAVEPPQNAGPLLEKVIYGLLAKDPEQRLDDASARAMLLEVVNAPDIPEVKAPAEPVDATKVVPLPPVPPQAPPSGAPGARKGEEAAERLKGAFRSVRKKAAAAATSARGAAGGAAAGGAGGAAGAASAGGAVAGGGAGNAGPASGASAGAGVTGSGVTGHGGGAAGAASGAASGTAASGAAASGAVGAGERIGGAAGSGGAERGAGAGGVGRGGGAGSGGAGSASGVASGSAGSGAGVGLNSAGAGAGSHGGARIPAQPSGPPKPPARAPLTDVVPRRTLVIIAVVVALAVLGTVLAFALNGDGAKDDKSGGGTSSSSGATAGGEGEEKGSGKDSGKDSGKNDDSGSGKGKDGQGDQGKEQDDNSGSGKDDDAGQGSPIGGDGKGKDGAEETYKHPQGFSIGLPKGWKFRTTDRAGARFTGPNGQKLLIGWTPTPKDNPVADWKNQELGMRRAQYDRIRIEKVDFRGWNTADWEFTYVDGGTKYRSVDRGFVVNGGLGYGLMYTAKADDWGSDQRREAWRTFTRTFEPKK
ncbi:MULTISPECIES: serine/threonine-protein kinase [Streptomyces]|uniref:serine/threonine-protein kinase n=1 Tax=Streptomyces TaxID=1883 RepID=UPI000F657B67|nr:serine/threonine-protein kinase [Streptomyces alboflavus]